MDWVEVRFLTGTGLGWLDLKFYMDGQQYVAKKNTDSGDDGLEYTVVKRAGGKTDRIQIGCHES